MTFFEPETMILLRILFFPIGFMIGWWLCQILDRRR
jgi:hypothetical protein